MFYISFASGLINPEQTRDSSRVRSNARANNTVTDRGNLTRSVTCLKFDHIQGVNIFVSQSLRDIDSKSRDKQKD